MQASPYDLSEWGYPPIRIETAGGKADYVDRQRGFADAAKELRGRLLRELDPLLTAAARQESRTAAQEGTP